MPKITININCDNSPKMGIIRDFNTAFAKNDIETTLIYLEENVVWEIVGDYRQEGIDQVREMLKTYTETAAEMSLTSIITHGDEGAAEGVIIMGNGDTYRFCDVYKFSSHSASAKLKSVTSYVVKI